MDANDQKEADLIPVSRTELDAALQQLREDMEAEFQKLRAMVQTEVQHIQQHPGDTSVELELTSDNEGNVAQESNDKLNLANVREKQAVDCHQTPADEFTYTRSMSSAEVQHRLLKQNANYAWQSTLWDASVLVGANILGPGSSILLCLLLASAITVQYVFIYVISEFLVKHASSNDTVAGLEFWRDFVAHDFRHMEPHSGKSMASRVCTLDSSLEGSLHQQETFKKIDGFLPDHILNGHKVCILAILCFFAIVCIELRKCFTLIISLYGLVSPEVGTRLCLAEQGSKKLRFQSISRSRFVAICLLTLIRISIAFLLLIVSVNFLVNLSSVKTIFLFTVKFGFILNVDELLFNAFVPSAVAVLISQLAPIHAKHRLKVWAGLDRATVVCGIALAAVLVPAFVRIRVVGDQLDTMKNILCGGNTDFVFAINPTNGILEWAATQESDRASSLYVSAAVSELISMSKDGVPSLNGQSKLSFKVDMNRVKQLYTMLPGAQDADLFGQCVDRLDYFYKLEKTSYEMAQLILSSKIGSTVTSCQDVSVDDCDSAYFTEVRAWCSVRCGCGNYESGLFLNNPSAGCLSACFIKSSQGDTGSRLCNDMTAEEILARPEWSRFWKGSETYREYFTSSARSTKFEQAVSAVVNEAALVAGCGIIPIADRIGIDFCAGWNGISPVPFFCPESCKCTQEQVPRACPKSCRKQTNETFQFRCAGIVPGDDARQCNVTSLSPILYVIDSLEQQCCDAWNQLLFEHFVAGMISSAALNRFCCLQCVDKVLSHPDIAIFLEGTDFEYLCGALW